MNNDGWRLTEYEWRGWLDTLMRGDRQVVAPIEKDGLTLFRLASSVEDVSLADYGNTRWSPKEFQFPNTEALFSYRFEGDDVQLEGALPDSGEQALFGVRPCDAAGLTRLDDVFLGEEGDPFYADRKARTATISLACEIARPECFCTAVGCSPSGTEGSDVQLIPLSQDGTWLLRTLTPLGDELVQDVSENWIPATSEDWAKADAQQAAVEATMNQTPVSLEWASILENAFEHPLWEAVGERCLGCGICAYVCPSCSCFDVNDEGNAYCGTRCRVWDSCTFAQFTKHASVHNPRSDQSSRYRQRIMHKFAYFPLEHEKPSMCVGCGRCVALCPVGIDIHQSVQTVVSAGTSGEAST